MLTGIKCSFCDVVGSFEVVRRSCSIECNHSLFGLLLEDGAKWTGVLLIFFNYKSELIL